MAGGLADAFALIGAGLGVLLACGAALALLRGSYSKARIEALRGDNQDLRERVKDLEAAIDRSAIREKQFEERCSHFEQENKMLMELVTQRAEVSQVLEQLNLHHKESLRAWGRMSEAMERMAR